jgi:hypothetical protein
LTIESKLRAEVKYSMGSLTMEQARTKFIIPKDDMKIIIAHCIYDEEQYLEKCLEDDLKINDLDIIHILDGPWKHYDRRIDNSKTLDIINKFTVDHPEIRVVYETREYWESEPIKRNYQFTSIAEIFKGPYYVIIKDGDEFFHHLSGRQNSWLKKDLVEWIKYDNNIGLITCNAWYSDISLLVPRMFPSTRPVHYYTGKSMVIHDENHNIISDYNPTVRNSGDPKLCFVYQTMILINKYTLRDKERAEAKIKFVKYIESQNTSKECIYSTNLNQRDA